MRRKLGVPEWTTFMVVLLICGVSALLAALRPRSEESDRGGRDDPAKRTEWFQAQRAYPLDHIPAGARLRSIEQLKAKLQSDPPGALAGLSWTLLGPEPTNAGFSYPTTSGRVTALAVDPDNPSHVYLGAAEGGIWETTNGGVSWTPLTDTQPSLATGSIALAPSNPDIIYVGTGEEDFSTDSYYGAGILKSTNGGDTWTSIPGPFASGRMYVGSLAVHPTNSNIVLAGTNTGLFRSTDGGNTWTQVLSGAACTGAIFNPANGNTAYAALGSIWGNTNNGVYLSSNSGQTWTLDGGSGSQALPTLHVGRIALAISPSSPSTLFASIGNSSNSNLLGLYQTTNGGSTWTQLTTTPNYCAPQCWYDNVVAVDPTNPNVIFAGGSEENGTLLQSLNAGKTWTDVTVGGNLVELHEDHHALAFSANGATLYVGNDGGSWSTSNPTTQYPNWSSLNGTLAITQFYTEPSIAPNNPHLAYGGTQDNGIQQYTGGLTWNYGWCGDAAWPAIDFKVTSVVYASCTLYDVEKSTQGGGVGTWNPANFGISTGDRMQFIPPLVMDPLNNLTLFFGSYRVYQTTNGAGSWQTISSDLTGGSGSVTAIAVSPTNDKILYVGTSRGQVQMTTNAGSGATWTNVSTGLPGRSITQIAVSPTISSTAYVSYSGFPGVGGHVYHTTNSGTSWTDISTGLPDTPVDDILVDPTYANTLYAATDIGVFYTPNGGTTWTALVDGLPNVAVLGLKMYVPTHTLWAATHGRGVWSISPATLGNIRR